MTGTSDPFEQARRDLQDAPKPFRLAGEPSRSDTSGMTTGATPRPQPLPQRRDAWVTLAVDGHIRNVSDFDRLHVPDALVEVVVDRVEDLDSCEPPPVGTGRMAPGYAGLRVEAEGLDLAAFEGYVTLNGSWYQDPDRIVETLVLQRCAELGYSRSRECLRAVSRAARRGRSAHRPWTWLRGGSFG